MVTVIRDDESVDDLIARAAAIAEKIVNEKRHRLAWWCRLLRIATNNTNKKRPLQKQADHIDSLDSVTDVTN